MVISLLLWFQLELATRQNNVNSLLHKKKVADNVKLCMALLKQKEKELIEEIESRRSENEQALLLQQVTMVTIVAIVTIVTIVTIVAIVTIVTIVAIVTIVTIVTMVTIVTIAIIVTIVTIVTIAIIVTIVTIVTGLCARRSLTLNVH